MDKQFLDKAKKEITVGSYIVYGHNLGRCAGLKFGKVLKIKTYEPEDNYSSGVTFTVVGVDDDWNFQEPFLSKKGNLMFADRILVLDFNQLPEYAQKLLKDI
jgi:hypothetical protein